MEGVVEKGSYVAVARAIRYTIAGMLTFLFLYPFYSVLLISFNDPVELMKGFPFWLPSKWSLVNYEYVFRSAVIWPAASISVARTIVTTAVGLLCNGMLAFALTRKKVYGRRFINLVFIVTMYVSGGLIPYYIQLVEMGLINKLYLCGCEITQTTSHV